MLPLQEHLPEGKLGNLIALPLQGRALRNGNSAFVDENWNAYPDQWGALKSARKLSIKEIEDKIEVQLSILDACRKNRNGSPRRTSTATPSVWNRL